MAILFGIKHTDIDLPKQLTFDFNFYKQGFEVSEQDSTKDERHKLRSDKGQKPLRVILKELSTSKIISKP
ncbi:hypothetical protein VNO77_01727 [Canavalia gladiata]|uniref:Uncharacterized protein n=1 Tax=Canavalia gladiata TaxID=3824 RepID=A0AAN9R584_CANGL